MRGNPIASAIRSTPTRSIPACAGEPSSQRFSPGARTVYPRVCGGTCGQGSLVSLKPGLSPRVRGNPSPAAVAGPPVGSIPACAGEPTSHIPRQIVSAVYPRVCGGTRSCHFHFLTQAGLSPRVRGNRRCLRRRAGRSGSIPACAGEPRWPGGVSGSRWVYPRVCGGTTGSANARGTACGLSPRVRGNPLSAAARIAPFGSIPACAGEPVEERRQRTPGKVYPRVCGGTPNRRFPPPIQRGLSPRVRGNRRSRIGASRILRSIPACAGEPRSGDTAFLPAMVYPRVCGGTPRPSGITHKTGGLSPRVRGNLPETTVLGLFEWSIPACAGEPPPGDTASMLSTVYPRVCGGTLAIPPAWRANKGLSPRVRGNPNGPASRQLKTGSIPACAGEPTCILLNHIVKRVYPRVCGGTWAPGSEGHPPQGLSPRVRGNHLSTAYIHSAIRSIPACAGEPMSDTLALPTFPVYPRVCGGTPESCRQESPPGGLSPRVRGNPNGARATGCASGSIPACAGEPLHFRPRLW